MSHSCGGASAGRLSFQDRYLVPWIFAAVAGGLLPGFLRPGTVKAPEG